MGILLLVAAYALPVPSQPVGDEATDLMAAASLWHDRDLRYEPRDLARSYAVWNNGPRGLTLVADSPHGALVYARPFPYPVLAAPAYGLLGPRGLRVLNVVLYLALFQFARWRLGGPPSRPATASAGAVRTKRPRGAVLLLSGVLFAGAGLVWTLRFQSEVFLTVCTFFALATWCRVRSEPVWGRRELLPLAGAGALFAVVAVSEPPLLLLALPVAVDLLWARRFKGAAVFAGAVLAAGLVLAGVQERLTGTWGWVLAEEGRTFAGAYPHEVRPVAEADPAAVPAGSEGASPALLARRVGWLLAGRHVGVLPYFPFLLFLAGLYGADLRRPRGRSRHLMAAALLAYLAFAVGHFSWATTPGAAGAAAPGARALALVAPIFLLLPRRLRAGRWVILPFAAAGLWVVPALAVAASGSAPDFLLELPARGPTFRPLPMELELLADGRLPGYAAFRRLPEGQGELWLVPRETFHVAERHPDGVWVGGGSRSEVFVIASERVVAVRFRARSIASENDLRVVGDGQTLRARFDTEGKRNGVPVAVAPELVARGLGLFLKESPGEERIYRFVLETTGGAVPARMEPGNTDRRYLGVFLEL